MKQVDLMPSSDFLITAARNGDVVAINQLIKLWQKRIYNFALKYFNDHDQAMEVTQKTFISMNKNLSKLKDDQSFKPWLYRIATNYCHEEVRRQSKKWVLPFMKVHKKEDQQHIAAIEQVDTLGNPESAYGNQELKALLKKALSTLPEEQRLVVIMKEYEGLKLREIAVAMEISENTVKSRLYYALGSLRQRLEEWQITRENIHYEL